MFLSTNLLSQSQLEASVAQGKWARNPQNLKVPVSGLSLSSCAMTDHRGALPGLICIVTWKATLFVVPRLGNRSIAQALCPQSPDTSPLPAHWEWQETIKLIQSIGLERRGRQSFSVLCCSLQNLDHRLIHFLPSPWNQESGSEQGWCSRTGMQPQSTVTNNDHPAELEILSLQILKDDIPGVFFTWKMLLLSFYTGSGQHTVCFKDLPHGQVLPFYYRFLQL